MKSDHALLNMAALYMVRRTNGHILLQYFIQTTIAISISTKSYFIIILIICLFAALKSGFRVRINVSTKATLYSP